MTVVRDIKTAIGHAVDDDVLVSAFDTHWPAFEAALRAAAQGDASPPTPARSDRELLEDISERLEAVEIGYSSETEELTNLANRMMTLIERVSDENAVLRTGRPMGRGLAALLEPTLTRKGLAAALADAIDDDSNSGSSS